MSKARGLADLGNVYNDSALSNRNLIINGAMQVAQRGTSFAGLTNGTPKYTLDRWKFSEGGAPTGVLTITQDTDVPAGFGSSLKVDCTTANASLAGGALLKLAYRIEGQDLQQLGYGGAGAQQTTISFWVKSNKTGTYAIMVFQPDDTRQEQVQYTIDVADTWEKKTGIITADTTGVIDNNTGAGLILTFALGAGNAWTEGTAPTAWKSYLKADAYAGQTVNLSDNTANYFNITGVQLEVGDTATPFEHRSYDQEHTLCQRYFQRYGAGATDGRIGVGGWNNSTSADMLISLTHEMRVTPTVSAPSKGRVLDFAVAWYPITSFITGESTTKTVNIGATISGTSGAAQGDSAFLGGGGGAYDYQMDAEL